jgi:2-keto-4-pentenoate hydratase/2-oxohepta-3-ene-1,7-dioic acid hydratase in catechol pathway
MRGSAMKIVRYRYQGKTSCGVLVGKTVHQVKGTIFGKLERTGEKQRLSRVRLLTPCQPSKVVAVGLNYRLHAKETKQKVPEEPMIFLMPPTAVIGPGDDIVYPPISKRVDFEGELGVVMGKKAKNVPEDKALDYVLGYTCVNDVTARDLQAREAQFTRSKGMDTFCPIGPCIETELDPHDLELETYLNGKLKQSSNTSDMVFTVQQVIAYITQAMTLLPGDVVTTGTPSGIAPMKVGDTVEVRISGIGELRNRIVSQ